MSDKIKDLIKRLRANGQKNYGLYAEAADALEALAAECDLVRSSMRSAVAERDRLKDEVERLRNEKVAGQDTAKPEAIERSTPATDPAPAVCEWTRTPWGRAPSASSVDALYIPRCDADYLRNVPGSGMCHRCGKPIKLTEAME